MFTLEKAEIIYANIQANLTNLFADEKYSHSNAPIAYMLSRNPLERIQ